MTKDCAQCGNAFDAKSRVHKFCSDRCQADHRRGRSREMTLHRQTTGFAWDPVRKPGALSIKPGKVTKSRHPWKKVLVLPDTQIGYRRLPDDSVESFHDIDAMGAALSLAREMRPDLLVCLGDYLDLPVFGRFRLEPGFAGVTQRSFDEGYRWLAAFRATCTEMALIEGNHDARLSNWIEDNALSAAGLRRAGGVPEGWPVLSIPYLLRLDELGIEYVGAYPSGAKYLNDNLACIHGHVVKSNGSTAAELTKKEAVSVIFGHVHRRETHWTTRNARGRAVQLMAHSPGTLSRIDGAVPSVHSALDRRTGKANRHWEDWQQGVTVVHVETEGEQRFRIEPCPIDEGVLYYRDQEYTPTRL